MWDIIIMLATGFGLLAAGYVASDFFGDKPKENWLAYVWTTLGIVILSWTIFAVWAKYTIGM